MHRILRPLLALIIICVLALPAHGSIALAATDTSYRSGELLVKVQPGVQIASGGKAQALTAGAHSAATELTRALSSLQVYAVESLGPGSATYLLHFRQRSDPARLAARLNAAPGVVFAEPNYLRTMMRMPNDPAVSQQWALTNIQAFDAWDITTGVTVPIAVLDTGVAAGHPDLDGKVTAGFNAINQSSNAADDNGHGTAVAGLIAARTDNGAGIAGMCWGCMIMPVKVLTGRGSGSDAWVARGMRWATDNGARVINMSLGGSEDSQVLREAVDYALSRGVLIVASSGNERQDGNAVNYPAGYPGVLAVGATGNTDVVTGFSNTGDHVALTAPGVGLWTTLLNGEYGPPNGTSFASPYVAGAAGLVLSLRPDLPGAEVACVLSASADDKGVPGKDPEYGWGRLNALRAVQLAQAYSGCPLTAPPPAAPETPAPPDQGTPPPPFAPIAPFPSTANRFYFSETGHSLGGEFLRYWQRHGGLPIFGYPISEEFRETGSDGREYVVQYFERHRFEFHPENAPPYNVQLSRIGDDILQLQGRDWFTFPKSGPRSGCLYFEATGHSVCDAFLLYWRASGLEFDGQPGKSMAESLALFGQPISGPQVEEVAPGVFVTVQWFERARFEDHGASGVLLGRLGDELTRARGWR